MEIILALIYIFISNLLQNESGEQTFPEFGSRPYYFHLNTMAPNSIFTYTEWAEILVYSNKLHFNAAK